MKTFQDLGLKKDILHTLASLEIEKPREVQEKIIPLAQAGKNIVFTSRTGSGKTLAYLLPFLSKINTKQGIQVVILVPTRELCIQVHKEVKKVAEPLNIKTGALYGGRQIAGDQKTTMKKLQILVGTPGRLIQHINAKRIFVGDNKVIIYDESDQMFDDGFMEECKYVKQRSSKHTQIILASATITPKVHAFIAENISDHEFLEIGDMVPKNIVQEKVFCPIKEKNDIMIPLLKEKKFKRAMIFCNTKVRTEFLTELLVKNKFKARPLSSDLKQDARTNTLNLFKQGRVQVLITTDVAARGLHIENVDIVVNYDIPRQDEFYVHRIGRTGRSDSAGYAINFVCEEDQTRMKRIEEAYDLDIKEIKR